MPMTPVDEAIERSDALRQLRDITSPLRGDFSFLIRSVPVPPRAGGILQDMRVDRPGLQRVPLEVFRPAFYMVFAALFAAAIYPELPRLAQDNRSWPAVTVVCIVVFELVQRARLVAAVRTSRALSVARRKLFMNR